MDITHPNIRCNNNTHTNAQYKSQAPFGFAKIIITKTPFIFTSFYIILTNDCNYYF